jgi:hypothetical protein
MGLFKQLSEYLWSSHQINALGNDRFKEELTSLTDRRLNLYHLQDKPVGVKTDLTL